MRHLKLAVGCLALLLLASAAVDNTNLGSGWYGNLPPVTRAQLDPVIACLMEAGAPRRVEVYTDPVYDWGDGRTRTPAMIEWQESGGRVARTDAVWTYMSPLVAYVDIMRDLRQPAPVERHAGIRDCVAAAKATAPVVTLQPNPLGEKQPADWCLDRVGVPDCWQGNAGDKFIPGGGFTDAGGISYTKVSGGRFFFTWSVWRQK